jgi:hypothetical protein
MLGFEEELGNFTLGLTNPSTQSELLKIEQWKEKITLYKDAVTDPGSGIQAVSATWGKKHILGFSDEEIKLDLQQQRIEKAVGEELNQTATIIKNTGIFSNIDKLYGETQPDGGGAEEAAEGGEVEEPAGDLGGGDLGGGDLGGGDEGGGAGLELASINKSKLPLILENLDNNNFTVDLEKGKNKLDEVTNKVDSLLTE